MRDADQLQETLTYVVIPADSSQPLQECSVTTKPHPEALLEHIKPMFASGSDQVDVSLLQQQSNGAATNLFASSTGDALPQVSHDVLQQVAKEAHVETFTLVHPTLSNQKTSVVMYLDEVGMLKRLPLNKRASDYAARAGYNPPPQFYGTVILSRFQYSTSRVDGTAVKHVLNFTMDDASPHATWLMQAAQDNLQHQQQFNQATGAKLEQAAIQGTDGTVAVEQDYTWTQTEEELELRIVSDEPVTKKDVKIQFAPQMLQVHKPKVVSIALFERVDVESCTWTIDKNELVISMEKQEAAFWPRIIN